MYDRRLNGRTLRFGHQGMLYHDSFVMYDHETGSWWVHVTGEAFAGPLLGQRLRFLPSTVATWAEWRTRFPETTVLPGRRSESFMGHYEGRERAHLFGLSVVVRFRAKLYPFSTLARGPVVNDAFANQPLLVAYAVESGTATAWSRTVDGRVLTFEPGPGLDHFGQSLLRDVQTGSLWNGRSGEAVGGPLQGQMLTPIPHHPILTDRFRVFYPEAPVYEGS